MAIKLTTDQFIQKSKSIHGDIYDYSLSVYINARTKIKIIDPDYGEFEQLPSSHLRGIGNSIRNGGVKLNTENFIKKANIVHNNFYDYSKVIYIDNKIKVKIIDPIYGEFEQSPNGHLSGQGHPKRSKNFKLTTEEFIKRSKEIHNNLYDYSKVILKGSHSKITIIDPIYGEFEQKAYSHLQGVGNPERMGGVNITTEEFIKRSRKVHGDFYDYSKVEYITSYHSVIIIDPDYGEFEQKAYHHLQGVGCPYRYYNNCNKEVDHIIPFSLLCYSKNRKYFSKTALGKLFECKFNKQILTREENIKKSDFIDLFGEKIKGSSNRGDIELIRYFFKRTFELDVEIKEKSVYIKQLKILLEDDN